MAFRPKEDDLITRLERFRTAISITQSEWTAAREAVAEAISVIKQLRTPMDRDLSASR